MRRRFLFCIGLCFFLPLGLGAQNQLTPFDWPQFRGPNRDGISPEKGLLKSWPAGGPKLLWNSKTVAGGKSIGAGYSSVAVTQGKIFTMGDHGNDGFVYCLDEKTGKELWAVKISPGVVMNEYPGPRSTPTIDGDRLYTVSRQGILVCLTTAKGELVWRKDFAKDFGGKSMSSWDFSESVLIDGDKLICTPGADSAALVALDKFKGNVIWKSQIDKCGGAGYSSIVVSEAGGVRQYVTLLGSSKGLVSVDAKTGKFLWNYQKITNGTANIPSPAVKGDYVFASTGYNLGGAALLHLVSKGGEFTPDVVYHHPPKTLQNHHGGFVMIGDYIYGGNGHNEGHPFCIEWKTGKLAWKQEPGDHPGENSAAVVYADGNVYFRYPDGTVLLVEATPARFKINGQFQVPNDPPYVGRSHPAIANRRLYLRGDDQLYCYDIKAR